MLVVTRTRRATAPSTFAHSSSARSSARHAETSLRAHSRTSPSALAQAAMPQAIAPLPAIPGLVYPSEPLTPPGYYHAWDAREGHGWSVVPLVSPPERPTLNAMEQRAQRLRPVFGAAAAAVVAIMVVGAFSMWTVIPFGWIWIGSKVSDTQEPSGGPYMVVFVGIVVSICTMAWILSRLNRVYVRITGSARLPRRYLPAWRKSLSDERGSPYGMSVLEGVILASVLLACLAMAIWFFIAAGSPLPSE
jgi:hypothetical protein